MISPKKADDLFLKMGIEGGTAAITQAAAAFIQLHPLYPFPPSGQDLSENELELLKEGGFPDVPGSISVANNMTKITAEVGVLIASAVSQSDAAQLMGVDESRIRQRISNSTLYAVIGENNKKVLPRFQFTDKGILPGLDKVLPLIDKDAHPVAVQRFFLTISEDLYSKETHSNLSPRDWLMTGHSPESVVLMAADL